MHIKTANYRILAVLEKIPWVRGWDSSGIEGEVERYSGLTPQKHCIDYDITFQFYRNTL